MLGGGAWVYVNDARIDSNLCFDMIALNLKGVSLVDELDDVDQKSLL